MKLKATSCKVEEKACVGGDYWDRLHTCRVLGINQNSKQKALLTSYIHGMSQLCNQFNPFVEVRAMVCTTGHHSHIYVRVNHTHNEDNKN